MPSEPFEAEFAFPPALTRTQEEEYRELELEGPLPLSPTATRHSQNIVANGGKLDVSDLEKDYEAQGIHVVVFEKGMGEDPREWSTGKKWYITFATSLLCTVVALGSSIVTGDLRAPVEELHTTQEIVNLTVTCFVIGFGIGPLLFAPLSEVVGRKPIYCVSIFLYFIFTLPSCLAKNAATLVVARQIAGIAASAPMCNVGGSVADVWSVEQRGIPMAIFSGTIFLGPCLGPLFGAWIGARAGWRWIYWVLFIMVGAAFIFTLFIPETLSAVLLRRKAQRLRNQTGDDRYKSLGEMHHVPLLEKLKVACSRPLVMMVFEPIILFMSFYLSFVYSLLYLLFFAFPLAFEEIRHFSQGMVGVTFVSIMLGVIAALCIIPYQERIYRKVTVDGIFPEARLYPMLLGAIVLPVALFIFAFTGAYAHIHWIAPCIAGTLFGFAMIFIYVAANSYIVDSFSDYAASAIAAKTLMRSVIGAMVPLFVNQMFHNMGFQYAGLLLALIAGLIGPIPFVFYRYGGQIRSKSSRATTALRGQGFRGEKDVPH